MRPRFLPRPKRRRDQQSSEPGLWRSSGGFVSQASHNRRAAARRGGSDTDAAGGAPPSLHPLGVLPIRIINERIAQRLRYGLAAGEDLVAAVDRRQLAGGAGQSRHGVFPVLFPLPRSPLPRSPRFRRRALAIAAKVFEPGWAHRPIRRGAGDLPVGPQRRLGAGQFMRRRSNVHARVMQDVAFAYECHIVKLTQFQQSHLRFVFPTFSRLIGASKPTAAGDRPKPADHGLSRDRARPRLRLRRHPVCRSLLRHPRHCRLPRRQ
jgi:hypothetical protein